MVTHYTEYSKMVFQESKWVCISYFALNYYAVCRLVSEMCRGRTSIEVQPFGLVDFLRWCQSKWGQMLAKNEELCESYDILQ